MSKEDQSLQRIINELLEVFPFPDLERLVYSMKEPMKCNDTAEMLDAIQSNLDLLKKEEAKQLSGGSSFEKESVLSFINNPSNFTRQQWKAISKTKELIRSYERDVDAALESGEIKAVPIEEQQKRLAKRKKRRSKRFRKRKKWMEI